MIEEVKILYEYFYQTTTGNKFFEFNPKEREQKMIENFVKLLSPSNGEDWLFNYFCFQWSRYFDLKTRFDKGVVMLGWVIGKKAFIKYKQAPDEEKYWGEVFKNRFGLRNPLLKPLSIEINKSYFNRERKRFKQLERQFIHCLEMDLFDRKNSICMFCKNKKECNGRSC